MTRPRGCTTASITALESLGGIAVEFDFRPFREAAALLYAGPWVAERLAALQDFFAAHADDVHPVVRGIIAGGGEVQRRGRVSWRSTDWKNCAAQTERSLADMPTCCCCRRRGRPTRWPKSRPTRCA